jgi:putative tryptophan/tyrosine transport system substrate-binding protein
MKRRTFITLLGGAAAAWPLAARAQGRNGPVRLGFLPLGSSSNAYDRSLVEAFQQGLRQAGLIEDRDIVLDVVWSSGDPDQAVSEVLRRGAELLIPCGSSASVAAKRQTSSIPIVFLSVGDPKAMGLVETLSHPGRNATGFSDILADLSGKLVDLARELSKPQTTVDYLWYTAWPDGQNRYQATEQAAQAAGLKLRSKGIADIGELDDAWNRDAIVSAHPRRRVARMRRFGALQVDEQLDSGGLLNGEIGGLGAFKDTVHVERSSTVHVEIVGAIRDQ